MCPPFAIFLKSFFPSETNSEMGRLCVKADLTTRAWRVHASPLEKAMFVFPTNLQINIASVSHEKLAFFGQNMIIPGGTSLGQRLILADRSFVIWVDFEYDNHIRSFQHLTWWSRTWTIHRPKAYSRTTPSPFSFAKGKSRRLMRRSSDSPEA